MQLVYDGEVFFKASSEGIFMYISVSACLMFWAKFPQQIIMNFSGKTGK